MQQKYFKRFYEQRFRLSRPGFIAAARSRFSRKPSSPALSTSPALKMFSPSRMTDEEIVDLLYRYEPQARPKICRQLGFDYSRYVTPEGGLRVPRQDEGPSQQTPWESRQDEGPSSGWGPDPSQSAGGWGEAAYVTPPAQTTGGSPDYERRRPDTRTPRGYSYLTDDEGHIVTNKEGNKVMQTMRELVMHTFRSTMFEDWDMQEGRKKELVLASLRRKYPQPHRDDEFSETWMLHRMKMYLAHKRSDARDACREGKSKPDFVSRQNWEMIRKELDEDKHRQQREAAAQRRTSSHLGSGGWDSMRHEFISEVEREPTSFEMKYAGKKGIKKLVQRLFSRGPRFDARRDPLREEQVQSSDSDHGDA